MINLNCRRWCCCYVHIIFLVLGANNLSFSFLPLHYYPYADKGKEWSLWSSHIILPFFHKVFNLFYYLFDLYNPTFIFLIGCLSLCFCKMESSKAQGKRSFKYKMEEDEDQEEEEEEDEDSGSGLGFGEDNETKKRAMTTTSSSSKRGSSAGGSTRPCCQADNCNADLTDAKHYHRRHKVCEFHAKAPVVLVAGHQQRFCQQCSRFVKTLNSQSRFLSMPIDAFRWFPKIFILSSLFSLICRR